MPEKWSALEREFERQNEARAAIETSLRELGDAEFEVPHAVLDAIEEACDVRTAAPSPFPFPFRT